MEEKNKNYEEKILSLSREVNDLNLLIRSQELINATIHLDTVLDYLMELAKKITNSEASSAILVEGDKLVFAAASGTKTAAIRKVYLDRYEGVAGSVLRSGEFVLIEDVTKDTRFSRKTDMMSGFTTRSILAVPLDSEEKIIGVLEVVNKKDGKMFDDNDIKLLNSLATSAAIAINKARLYKDLNELFLSTIKAIANAIEAKDPYTRGHSDRIRTYSLLIAKELGLKEQDIKNLEIAALLHDVGKIGVPEALLRKQGSLTPEENAEMMKHPVIGAEILFSIKQLEAAIPGIRHHQERYDGKGYPDKLKGEDIPVLARIIAVADTFDAMTSNRPYRMAMPDQDALKELEHCAGVQFDEKCVRAFVIGYLKSLQKNRNNENGKSGK